VSKAIQYLAIDELIEMGEALIPDFRIRDIGLLESASLRPETTIYGVEAYPTFPEKVAALMHSLSSNHTLIDGNKRIAWIGGRGFAIINGKDFEVDVDTAEKTIMSLASGELDAKSLALIIKDWLVDG
jgi:death-on-curing protein